MDNKWISGTNCQDSLRFTDKDCGSINKKVMRCHNSILYTPGPEALYFCNKAGAAGNNFFRTVSARLFLPIFPPKPFFYKSCRSAVPVIKRMNFYKNKMHERGKVK